MASAWRRLRAVSTAVPLDFDAEDRNTWVENLRPGMGPVNYGPGEEEEDECS